MLHKLLEEIVSGEIEEDHAALYERARTLIDQLTPEVEGKETPPDASELTATVLRTLRLPEIAAMRPRLVAEWLVAEWPVYAPLDSRTAIAGRVDAITNEDGAAPTVIDWKSDIAPTEAEIRNHAAQLADYCGVVGAARGALVYVTRGVVRWVEAG